LKVIKTTNHYFSALLKIECTKAETYGNYLEKIKKHENKYFNLRNYKEIALNTLLLKHLIDLKIKLKEHITKIDIINIPKLIRFDHFSVKTYQNL
jgi:hypothetical protein